MAGAGAIKSIDPFNTSAQEGAFQLADKAKAFEDTLPEAKTGAAKIGQGIGALVPGFLTAGAGAPGAAGQDTIDQGKSVGEAEGRLAGSAIANEAGLALGGLGNNPVSRAALQGSGSGALYEG